jgi:hypothetical protein
MIDWENILYSIQLPSNATNSTTPVVPVNGTVNATQVRNITFADICKQFNFTKFDDKDSDEYVPPPACQTSPKPLDFVYVKQNNNYMLQDYPTDAHLLYKMRSGKGDPKIFYGYNSLLIDIIFAGTYPNKIS